MGNEFFKRPGGMKINPGSGANLTARAINAGDYTARAAASGASKDLGAASALAKNMGKKPDRSGVYPKGPKV